jgi:hypothetical protein
MTHVEFVVVMDFLALANARPPLTSVVYVAARTNALDVIVLLGLELLMMNVVFAMEMTAAVAVTVLPSLAR